MGDTATKLLRTLGHNVSGMRLGSNRGATSEVVQGLRTRLERLHRESGQRVSLVAQLLSGVLAQELACVLPESVRNLTTLGSPVLRRSGCTLHLSKETAEATFMPRVAPRSSSG